MVLFIEDEKRIREMERREKLARRTRLGTWLRRFVKIALVLAVLFGISLLLLSGIKGDSESLKKGAQDYLSQATGLRADIGGFKNMRFFPDLVFEADSIAFYKGDGRESPVISVEKAQFSAGFFSMMLSQKRFKTLYIKNLRAESGLFGPRALVIDSLGLKSGGLAPGMSEPGLYIEGRYGEETIDGFLSMTEEKDAHSLPKKAAFTLTLGALDMAGRINRNSWRGVRIEIAAHGFTKDGIVKTAFEDSSAAKDSAQIRCLIGHFRIKDGAAQSEALYADAGEGLAAGTGSLDFRTMQATFKTEGPTVKAPSGFSIPALPEDHGCHSYLAPSAQDNAP